MPLYQTGKKTTSSTARIFTGSRFGKVEERVKVLNASQIHEQKRQLEEKKKNKERRKFQQHSRNKDAYRQFLHNRSV